MLELGCNFLGTFQNPRLSKTSLTFFPLPSSANAFVTNDGRYRPLSAVFPSRIVPLVRERGSFCTMAARRLLTVAVTSSPAFAWSRAQVLATRRTLALGRPPRPAAAASRAAALQPARMLRSSAPGKDAVQVSRFFALLFCCLLLSSSSLSSSFCFEFSAFPLWLSLLLSGDGSNDLRRSGRVVYSHSQLACACLSSCYLPLSK